MVAIVAFNAVSLANVGVEPIIAAELGSQLSLPGHQVGQIVAAEFAGSMLATFPSVLWARRVPTRRLALLAGLALLVCNLVSAYSLAYTPLLAWRALAGLAEGTLLILTLTVAAVTSQPARLYSWWVIGQTLLAAPALLFFPQLSAHFGLAALYTAMALAILLVLPLAAAFSADRPAVDSGRAHSSQWPAARAQSAARVLTVLLLYYLVAGGLWAFAGERGAQMRLRPDLIGWILGLAYLVSLAGAGLAALLGTQRRGRRLAVIGHVGLGLALMPFAVGENVYSFILFAVLMQVAWAFTAPLLMTLVSEIEPAGSMIGAGTFVIGAGLTLGPLLAGHLFEMPRGAVLLALLSGGAVIVSAVLLRTPKRSAPDPAF